MTSVTFTSSFSKRLELLPANQTLKVKYLDLKSQDKINLRKYQC